MRAGAMPPLGEWQSMRGNFGPWEPTRSSRGTWPGCHREVDNQQAAPHLLRRLPLCFSQKVYSGAI